MTARKTLLKILRPPYELAKKNRFTSNILFATLETIDTLYDYAYRLTGKKMIETIVASHPSFADSTVIISIAFNNATLIEKQIEEFKKFAPVNTLLVIADNSSRQETRTELAELCAREHVLYLDLPKNPRKQPNLSHSIVLNWLYYNFILKVRPYAFGFIDHDIFPIAPITITETLQKTPFYGLRQEKNSVDKKAWYLWAGFCFFRFNAVKDKKLNFSSVVFSDWKSFLGLDTGGGNFFVLYRDLPAHEVTLAHRTLNTTYQTETIDTWYHLQKSSFRDIDQINQLLAKI